LHDLRRAENASLVHRYYDPATEQFLSVDPLAYLTQAPYAYVAGDPVNESDSSGLWFGIDDLVATVVGGVVGAGTSIVEQAVSGHGINWAKVGISAGAGAAGGEASLYCGPGCGGAVASGFNEAGNELYETGRISPLHVATSAALGGTFGWASNGMNFAPETYQIAGGVAAGLLGDYFTNRFLNIPGNPRRPWQATLLAECLAS